MKTIVTHEDVKILQTYQVIDKIRFHQNRARGYHTGVDIECNKVYSGFPGTVIYIGKSVNFTYSVIVQYNENHAFAYMNLSSTNLKLGQFVDFDDEIGEPRKFVHVEYLNKDESSFPVMLVKQMFYKHDPMPILKDGYESFIDYATELAVSQNFLMNVKEA